MSERMVSTKPDTNCDVVGHNYVPAVTSGITDSTTSEMKTETSVLRIYCTKCGDVKSIAE